MCLYCRHIKTRVCLGKGQPERPGVLSNLDIFIYRLRDYNYFWVPVVGPHLGAIIGTAVYQLCVGMHWPEQESESDRPKTHENYDIEKKELRTEQMLELDGPIASL